jgi:hypothetical protein
VMSCDFGSLARTCRYRLVPSRENQHDVLSRPRDVHHTCVRAHSDTAGQRSPFDIDAVMFLDFRAQLMRDEMKRLLVHRAVLMA